MPFSLFTFISLFRRRMDMSVNAHCIAEPSDTLAFFLCVHTSVFQSFFLSCGKLENYTQHQKCLDSMSPMLRHFDKAFATNNNDGKGKKRGDCGWAVFPMRINCLCLAMKKGSMEMHIISWS